MLIDLNLLSSPPRELKPDICVCGGGPAGIVLALELAKRRPDWHIVLLEGGGNSVATERERLLYDVGVGEKPYAVAASRRRMLGGTSAHWGGWSKPLDPEDFTAPAAWSVPDWPITPEDLQPFLAAAHLWCEIPSDRYAAAEVRSRQPQRFLDLPEDGPVAERLFRFSPPTRFGTRYLEALTAQTNLDCYLHANLFGLERRGERIVSATAKSLDGQPLRIAAKRFVLTQGGLETTRTLLNLRGDASDDGIGLRSPHLGRHFADHYGVRPGSVLAPAELGYRRIADEGTAVMPVLAPSPALLSGSEQQNVCMMLEPAPGAGSLPDRYASHAAFGFSARAHWNYRAQMIVEPRPHPDSRITLTDARCELGLRRARLDWKIHPEDVTSALHFFEQFSRLLAQTGQGRTRLTYQPSAAQLAAAMGANHHLGTLRFARDPKDGVTDADGRIHDLDNLHVISSALFPRYGYSNPTLTLVALAVRLASRWAGSTPEQSA